MLFAFAALTAAAAEKLPVHEFEIKPYWNYRGTTGQRILYGWTVPDARTWVITLVEDQATQTCVTGSGRGGPWTRCTPLYPMNGDMYLFMENDLRSTTWVAAAPFSGDKAIAVTAGAGRPYSVGSTLYFLVLSNGAWNLANYRISVAAAAAGASAAPLPPVPANGVNDTVLVEGALVTDQDMQLDFRYPYTVFHLHQALSRAVVELLVPGVSPRDVRLGTIDRVPGGTSVAFTVLVRRTASTALMANDGVDARVRTAGPFLLHRLRNVFTPTPSQTQRETSHINVTDLRIAGSAAGQSSVSPGWRAWLHRAPFPPLGPSSSLSCTSP